MESFMDTNKVISSQQLKLISRKNINKNVHHKHELIHYGEGNSRIWSNVCRRVCGRNVATAPSAQTQQRVHPGWECRVGAALLGWGAPRGPCTCGDNRTSFSSNNTYVQLFCHTHSILQSWSWEIANVKLFQMLIKLLLWVREPERRATIITFFPDSLRLHGEH